MAMRRERYVGEPTPRQVFVRRSAVARYALGYALRARGDGLPRASLVELILEKSRLDVAACPQLERRRGLVDEHRVAVQGLGRAGCLGVAQQLGLGGHVHQVEHQQLRAPATPRRSGDCWSALRDRGSVDQHLGLGQLGLDDRLVPRHRPQLHVRGGSPEVTHQALRPMEVPVEDDDPLEAGRDQRVDRGPGAAAGADDHRCLGHLLAADQRVQRRAETDHVRVVTDQPCALARHRVDGAGLLGLLGQPVDHRHHPLLVREADVGAQVVLAAQLLDRVGQGHQGHIDRLVARVDTELVEGGLLKPARERLRYRMTDQKDPLGQS